MQLLLPMMEGGSVVFSQPFPCTETLHSPVCPLSQEGRLVPSPLVTLVCLAWSLGGIPSANSS